ncbi:SIS domain-containing protein [Ferroplasma acidiphilum]|uniref:SIS domain-containing protein n=1 Tax=Ferroplasma acidiphilum TaxID=74969 RepID=UPI00281599B9|nr:SIS domain-containing protein [Ferroplasma acidiphilum]WMT52529.1 MAG: SIS domain-containing protein [Ferroplasma acidiphilum]
MSELENEINEQKTIFSNSIKSIKDNVKAACDLISNKNPIFIIGSGTSYHSALYLNSMLDMVSINSRAVQSSQLKYIINNSDYKNGLIIAFSQSGESKDLIDAIESISGTKFTVIGITNSSKSKLTELSDVFISLNAGAEKAVTATKSFTTSLLASMIIRDTIKNTETDFAGMENTITNILNNGKIKEISKNITDNVIVLGDGLNYTIALEGALKLRETANIIGEGFPFREYLHGYIETLDKNTTVICIGNRPDKEISEYTDNIILLDDYISSSINSELFPIYYAIMLQLLAMHSALNRNLDPDRPEKLHKVVK